MPFNIIRNDITKVKADAIVNTANPFPVYGSGTDEKIYMAAGAEDLLKERERIGVIERGKAAVTKAYKLDAKYIIHTVGPWWQEGKHNEIETLESCLKECLRLATELNCESIAFPLISTGVYGFPKELALKTFTRVIYDFLMNSDMLVTLVVYDEESFNLSTKLFTNVEDFLTQPKYMFTTDLSGDTGFEEAIRITEMSFHDYLMQLIIESDMTNPQIYRNANITKQHFSKIISNKDYNPTKNTICALAISLSLDIDTLETLLKKAGYYLTDTKQFDLAVRYFINNQMYNIMEDNIILFDNNLDQLGTI